MTVWEWVGYGLLALGFAILMWDNIMLRRHISLQKDVISDLRSKLARYYLEERITAYKERRSDGTAR